MVAFRPQSRRWPAARHISADLVPVSRVQVSTYGVTTCTRLFFVFPGDFSVCVLMYKVESI